MSGGSATAISGGDGGYGALNFLDGGGGGGGGYPLGGGGGGSAGECQPTFGAAAGGGGGASFVAASATSPSIGLGATKNGKIVLRYVIDTVAPRTSITIAPPPISLVSSVSFSFTGSDDHTSPSALAFRCSMDGVAFTPCSSPATYTGLANGNHTFRVEAVDAVGNIDSAPPSATFVVAVPLQPVEPGPGLGLVGPLSIDRISALRISPATLVAAATGGPAVSAKARKTGAIVSYSGSQPATTTFTIQRVVAGRRSGRGCVKPTRHTTKHARCTLYVNVGSFTHTDTTGANRFRFTGRISGRKLTPGQYRLRAIPRNTAGTGPTVYKSFRVTK